MPGPSLGTNLISLSDWSTEFPFLNDFSMSRTWFTRSDTEWDTNQANLLDLDADGWVRGFTKDGAPAPFNRVGTVLFSDDQYRRPGRYIVDYEGEGELSFVGAVNVLTEESRPGRYVLDLPADTASTLIVVNIERTDPNRTGDYIREIRLYKEEYADLINAGEIFRPEFLAKIDGFRVLRFMDWMDTNFSTQSDWASRPTATDARWTVDGAPVEVMVALANQVHADPWFNIPHLATDEYIRQFATYVRDHLAPGLVARFEYSNEVWNWGFGQTHWAEAQARARWGENVEGGWMQYYGVRAAEMARVVADVFGAETGTRALNVFSTQAGWQGLEQYALNTPAHVAQGGAAPSTAPFHVYAIAPYFGGTTGSSEMSATVDQWIATGEQGFLDAIAFLRNGGAFDSLDRIGNMIGYHATAARSLGWQLEAYEGGQHIVDLDGLFGGAQDAAQSQFFIDLVRRPEFAQLYQEYFQIWRDSGGGMMAHFTDVSVPSRYGSFGLWDSIYSADTARAEAVIDWRDTVAPWWTDNRPASTFANGTLKAGTMGADVITGTALDDRLYGVGGDDTLNGGAGNDIMAGGLGNDAYLFNLGSGHDTVRELVGEGTADELRFGTGIAPGSITVSSVANGGRTDVLLAHSNGTDRVTLSNWTIGGANGVERVVFADGTVWLAADLLAVQDKTLYGTAAAETLNGGAGNDKLYGLAGNDTLNGGAGNDLLDGGAGNDGMAGGTGSDTYVVDSSADEITEAVDAGTDSVQSSVSFTLAANVENLSLTGTAASNGIGNALNNAITGNAASNLLDGGAGADTLTGGGGNDTYVVDNVGDVVVEAADQGSDSVQSSVTHTLAANVENLTLTGTAAVNATGNALANRITGNGANNVLDGAAGNDFLDGGAGVDRMLGGLGDDITHTLAANVENLTLTGTAAVNATGNALANRITGNGAGNVLSGGAGNDFLDGAAGTDGMLGGLGDDTYVVDNAADVVVEAAGQGTDTVQSSVTHTLGGNVEDLLLTGTAAVNATGNALANRITGNGANNILSGGAGADTLIGGGGLDTLTGGTGADRFKFVITSAGVDTIRDFSSAEGDKIQVVAANFGLTAGAAVTLRSGLSLPAANGRLAQFLYNSSNGQLWFDRDGTGTAFSSVQLASLSTRPLLSATDIQVVAA
ncbi:MAG: hypothetical protein HY778_05875 [Betaproteobacteria bacterium]|nr:hypothetical protein [Betaproteobacteria bacterium]